MFSSIQLGLKTNSLSNLNQSLKQQRSTHRQDGERTKLTNKRTRWTLTTFKLLRQFQAQQRFGYYIVEFVKFEVGAAATVILSILQ